MTTATATRIGQSQKERIDVDGQTFIKAAPIGRWTHVVRIDYQNSQGDWDYVIGKSGSLKAAEKWVPWPMNFEITLSVNGKRNYTEEEIADFKVKYPGAEVVRGRNRMVSSQVLRAPMQYSRKVIKIER